MSLICVILDSPVRGAAAAREGSVLRMPLASGSLLDRWTRHLAAFHPDRVIVLHPGDGGPDDDANGAAGELRVSSMGPAAWRDFIAVAEPADRLLLVDGRCVQVTPNHLRALLADESAPPVRHWINLAQLPGSFEEMVELGPDRAPRGLRRRFYGVTHHGGGAVIASVAPAGMLRDAIGDAPPSPDRVRSRLSELGVPSVDRISVAAAIDVSTPAGALEALAYASAEGAAAGRDRGARPHVAQGASVSPSARLMGAVRIHPGASVGDGCRIIGPAIIGPGAQIGAGALLSRVCVWPGAVVPPAARLSDQVVLPGGALTPAGEGSASSSIVLDCGNVSHPMGRVSRGLKRTADVVLSLVGLLLLSPLLAVVAAAIKFTSPGPVLFGHEREGRDGRRFRCWKFRTMVRDAHARQRELYTQSKVDGPQFKMDHDPRVTRVGDFLRRTNLDELPQLLNVLRGDMSLIGPRPSPFRENQLCMPWRRTRLAVRPGISGLWQVCRHDRGDSDFYQWIYFDNLYVQHQSVLLDLAILFVTIVTLGGRWPVPVEWLIPVRRPHRTTPAAADEKGALCASS